jgi:hypothetical protein
MKNIVVYYLAAFVPFVTILYLGRTHMINSYWFVCSLGFYVIIYRTYIDGKRLADKGIIEKKDIWRMIVPGRRLMFFKDLYLR